MFTQPPEVSDRRIAEAVCDGWRIGAATATYAALGFGSHHWHVRAGDDRWFATVDDLAMKRYSPDQPLRAGMLRLDAALSSARALADAGLEFVVAPEQTVAGTIMHLLDDRWAMALYPHVDGEHRSFGRYPSDADREQVVDLLVRLHAVPAATCPSAQPDSLVLPNRASLELAIADPTTAWDGGPFGELARQLVIRHAPAVQALLVEIDRLAARVVGRRDRWVITHGEPHPGNTIVTPAGVVMIDWDTARIGPPERDMWTFVEEDEACAARYAERSGVVLDPDAVEMYRLMWDAADIAIYVTEFRGVHADTEDCRVAWRGLQHHLDPARWRLV